MRWWPAIGARPARDWRRYGDRVVRHDPVVGGHQTEPRGAGRLRPTGHSGFRRSRRDGLARQAPRACRPDGPRRGRRPSAARRARSRRASSSRTSSRSSGCVTPRHRLVVASTSNRDRAPPRAHERAHELGEEHLVVLATRPSRARHRRRRARPTSPARSPTGSWRRASRASSTSGSRAVVDVERAVDGGETSRRSVIAGEHAVGHLADAPGHRQVADEGSVEAEADEAVGARRALVVPAEHRERVGAVEVVGVGDAERACRRRRRRARRARRRPCRSGAPGRRTRRRRPRPRASSRALGCAGPVSGLTTSTSAREARHAARRPASRSMTASPFGPIGASGLMPP